MRPGSASDRRAGWKRTTSVALGMVLACSEAPEAGLPPVPVPGPGIPWPDLEALKPDPAVIGANVAPIATPLLILVGTEDRLQGLAKTLHDALRQAGKAVRMDVYEHGYHDFVLGPQGQQRPDLPNGEILLGGAIEALERTVAFVKAEKPDAR